ncbi:hypothetical protein PMAC_000125 [Pneumocystis sp. 'macacae']|nr:hypothetical protein PMAC_000125 [Pneumocystis sp. 'macacae']
MKQPVKTHKNGKESSKGLLGSSTFNISKQNNSDVSKFKFGAFGSIRERIFSSVMIESLEFDGLSPDLVVIFKNISKKDTTTKLKALDDISTWIDDNPGKLNENNFLEIWSYLYPRLTIDADRQVRLSCHHVHHKIYNESGKRIAKFVKKIIGSWIASTFDNDRAVKKAAIESFNTVFKTSEKRLTVKKVYHKYILNFNKNVILKELPSTLSDLRYVSQEISEVRYFKIISSILASLSDIILNLKLEEIKEEEDSYIEIVSSETFWQFLYQSDSDVRKYFYELIKNISNKWPELLMSQKNMIKKSITKLMENADHLFISVTLSTMEVFYLVCPEIWEHDFFGDYQTFSYFKKLILNNNFNSEQFWIYFYDLIIKIPLNPHKNNFKIYLNDFIDIIWEGVHKKTKNNIESAFEVFFKIICFYGKCFKNMDDIFSILEKKVSDIFKLYFNDFTSLGTKISDENFRHALIKGFLRNEYISNDLFNKFWYDSKKYIEKILSDTSIIYKENCDKLLIVGIRWINVADEFIREMKENVKNVKNDNLSDGKYLIFQIICEITYLIILYIRQHDDLCDKTLKLLDYILSKFTDIVFEDCRIVLELETFIMEKIPKFITSLTKSMMSIFLIYITENKNIENLKLLWISLFSHLSTIENKSKENIFVYEIAQMIIDNKIDMKKLKGRLPQIDLIDHVLLNSVHLNIKDIFENWESLNNLFAIKEIIFSKEVIIESLLCLTEKVFFSNDSEFHSNIYDVKILTLLYKVLNDSFDLYLCFLQNVRAIEFHIKMWNFSQIEKENISENIVLFNDMFEQVYCLSNKVGSDLRFNIANIIQKQILSLSSLDFLLMTSLHNLSIKILFYVSEVEKANLLNIFLFTSHEWNAAFTYLIFKYPNKNLELFNSLKICCLIFSNFIQTKKDIKVGNISDLLRMTVFSEMIIYSLMLKSCILEIHWLILYGIMVCGELVRDNFELEHANCLWKSITEEQEDKLFALINRSKDLFFNILSSKKIKILGIDDVVEQNDIKFLKKVKERSIGKSPETYYSACVLFRILQFLIEKNYYNQKEAEIWLNDINIENEQNIFIIAAIVNGFQEKLFFSKKLENIRDRICSDLSGKLVVDQDLKKLILFNIFIPFDDTLWRHLPQQRIETKIKNQPLLICTQLLSEILTQIPLNIIEKQLLYPHLLSQSRCTQIVTFDWLTNWISKNQEDLILDTEFSKINADLPSELLSMVLSPPYCYNLLNDIGHKNNMFCEIRCFFLSWILIFIHFKNTSFILKSSYIENLKNNNCISIAIELIFKILELLNNRFMNSIEILRDISKWKNIDDIKTEILSLATYVYLLILKHVPSIARDWWISCKNRQLTQLVETFTEKYISPILIEEEINLVLLEFTQLKITDNNIHVKISKTTREVTTFYTIDDQYLEMIIRLPSCYPLSQVIVEGLQKIGIKDAQWRAWLLASRILVTTQNGSIVDAVNLFKRNVSLHFEGVAECNICFSILSVQDRSLPSKKCATCKNKFHSGCLYKWFKTSNASKCPLYVFLVIWTNFLIAFFLKIFVWVSLLVGSNAYPLSIIRRGSRSIHNEGLSHSGNSQKGCLFPFNNFELSAVTSDNGKLGWATGLGDICSAGSYCSYYCRSGYHARLNSRILGLSSSFSEGRLFCDGSGNLQMPSESLCVRASHSVYLLNLFDVSLSFCERIFSNGGLRLASNSVNGRSFSELTIPYESSGPSSSFYYLGPPGTGRDGCTMGNRFSNQGLWSPYTLGISKDYKGDIHLTLGWNPTYIGDSYWSGVTPNWGIRIDCEGFGCGSKSCFIDPSVHGINECENPVNSYSSAAFCAVRISLNTRTRVVLFSRSNVNDELKVLSSLPHFDFQDSSETKLVPGTVDVSESKHEESKSIVDKVEITEHHESNDKVEDDTDAQVTVLNKQEAEESTHTVDKNSDSEHSKTSELDSFDNKKSTFTDLLSKVDISSVTSLGQSSFGSNGYIFGNDGLTLMLFQLHGNKNNHIHTSGASCPLSIHDNSNSLSVSSPHSVSDDCAPTNALLFLDRHVSDGYKLLADKFDNYLTKISSLIRNGDFQVLELDTPRNNNESDSVNNGTQHESSAYIMKNNILWTSIEMYLLGHEVRNDITDVHYFKTISNRQSFAIVYISVFVMTYCISLESQTTSNLIVPATSYFGKNSLIPLINTINGVLYAVVKQQMAKLGVIFGRIEGFCFSLLLYDMGCMMYMMSTNIVTFIISSILHTIGSTGIQILQQIIISDMSNFLNRGLLNSILDIPLLINVWVGPSLAQNIYLPEPASEQWRLGYGIWAVVLSIGSLPVIIVLYLGQFRSEGIRMLSLENNDGSITFSMKRIFIELDLVGIMILSFGLIMLLFQLIHEFPIFYDVKSLYIITIFVIVTILCVIFPLWECFYAKYPIFDITSFKLGMIGSGYFSSFFYFMGFYLYNNYFSTYLYVTKSNSIKRVGYLNNVFSFTSTIVAIFVGIFVKYNKRYNFFIYIGSPIYMIGIVYMIYNLRVDESVIEMTISQAIIGISGGIYNMSALIGIQTVSCRQQVVVNTTLFLTLASLGGAIGSAISGIMWSSLLPKMLKIYSERLNIFLTSSDYTLIIGSPFILDQYPKFVKGTLGRMAIILAYNDLMKVLYISSAMCTIPMLFCVMFMKDIHLNRIKQEVYNDNVYKFSDELKKH